MRERTIDRELGCSVGALIEEHLVAEEARRKTVSRVATGAAFEAWLAVETRLQMELHRARLGLEGVVDDSTGHPVDRYWIGNEYKKVDLGVLEQREDDEDHWVAAFEFKLVTNNKNWQAKCDEVWADLAPPRGSKKASIRPARGRFAVLAVMGKVYRETSQGGWRPDLAVWEKKDLEKYLLPTSGPYAGRVERVWRSATRFELDDCWLSREHQGHFLQLHVLARTDR